MILKRFKDWKIVVGLCLLVAFVFGCGAHGSHQKEKTWGGAAVGGAIGAGLGQVLGKDTESTLLGVAIGAALGGLAGNQIGRYMDQQEQALRQIATQSAAYTDAQVGQIRNLMIQRDREVIQATLRGTAMFEYNSARLLPGGVAEISRIAQVLTQYPKTTVVVEGHTDSAGPDDYNQTLSEQRALAVANLLVSNGVAGERITVYGYGESRPISSSSAMNRRVEIYIKPVTK